MTHNKPTTSRHVENHDDKPPPPTTTSPSHQWPPSHHRRKRACMLVFVVLHHHHLSTAEIEHACSISMVVSCSLSPPPTTIENRASFMLDFDGDWLFYITTTPTLSKSSTHARFWQCGWLFFVTTLEIEHACSFSMVVVCFLSPPSHHPWNWAYWLMFFVVNIIIKCFFVVIIIIKYFIVIIQWFKSETRG